MAGIGLNPGKCCGCGANFSHTFTLVGCANPAKTPALFAGQTIEVWTASGGTLLASGTTNSSGQVTLSWTDTAGPNTRYVTATTPWTGRNDAFAANRSLTNGGGTTLTLPANSSYVCCTNVDWAIPKTLYWTDSDGGPHTLTWSGGTQWDVSLNMAGTAAGLSGCSPPTCTTSAINGRMILSVGCGGVSNQVGIVRTWRTIRCGAVTYYLSDSATVCTILGNQCSAGAPYGTSGGPPLAFSGTLTDQGCGYIGTAVPNPVPGTVTVTE